MAAVPRWRSRPGRPRPTVCAIRAARRPTARGRPPSSRLTRRCGWGRDIAHAQAPHAARIAVENLELDAGRMLDQLAPARHPARKADDEPAQGVILFA